MIHDSVLSIIGQTPLVRIRAFENEHPGWCLFGKCEFLNAGGSIKDRIAYQMIIDAEREGRIQPGDTLIEATSGNTGIGLALVGALRGYKVIVTMPDRMSMDKTRILEALGATVYRTDSYVNSYDPKGYIGFALDLVQKLPQAHILDQYTNHSNVKAHEEGTGPEIAQSLDGRPLDLFVAGMGTGGTITGCSRYLRTHYPNLTTIGVEPYRSVFHPDSVNQDLSHHPKHRVEGIGSDFLPPIFEQEHITICTKVADQHAFETAKTLIRSDGLMVGGSSGAAVYAALSYIKEQPIPSHHETRTCVVILPDGALNYLSTFLNPTWMHETYGDAGQVHEHHNTIKDAA